MIRFKGGERVGKGTYWNFANGERIDIDGEGILPGEDTYVRMPSSGILVLGPVLGLLYAVFLPFIGIAMLIKVVVQKVAVAGGLASPAKAGVSFGWRPSESYLAGKKKEKTEKKEEETKEKE